MEVCHLNTPALRLLDVTVGEYHLDFLPFDSDLLSLELESSFKEVSLVCFSGKKNSH